MNRLQNKRRMMGLSRSNNLLLFFLVVFSIAGAAEYRVKTGNFTGTTILSGSIQAQKAERFDVPSSNTWQIQIKWMVKEGTFVNPGDTVVRFDTANLVSEIVNLEMSLLTREEERKQKTAERKHKEFELDVQLKQAEIEYKKAKLDADVPKGIFPDYRYDRKQLEMKKRLKAFDTAKMEKTTQMAALDTAIKKKDIELEESKTKLKRLQDTLDRLTLKAKTAGSVVYGMHRWQGRKIVVGDTVSPSWAIASIPDTSSFQVEAWVNETDINRIKPRQPVDISLDAYPDRTFTGKIKSVLNNAEKRDEWGKAHYFWVLIELDSRDLGIMKPGMSVKCVVRSANRRQVLLLPLQAAYFDGSDFWIKPKGEEAIKINPLGYNEFSLALEPGGKLKEGSLLEEVDPAAIKNKGDGQ